MSMPIYLDYQATTPTDQRVVDAMLPWMNQASNSHAIEHSIGRKAEEAVKNAQKQIASAVNGDPNNVIFTSGATEAANLVIQSFATPKNKIIISDIEHPCVMDTAKMCEDSGTDVVMVPVNQDGIIDLDFLSEHLEDCDLVSIMSVNNEIGTIQPIEDIGYLCTSADVPFHTDATQAVGKIPIDMSIGITYLTFSAHKIYGPTGIGAICALPESLQKIKPLMYGGDQQSSIRPGTLSVALSVGFGEACNLAVSELDQDFQLAEQLSQQLLSKLRENNIKFSINGSETLRVPHNLNISIDGITASNLIEILPSLAISTGSACSAGAIGSSKVLSALNLDEERKDSAIRIGFGRQSNSKEITDAVKMIADAVNKIKED